jgi:hypothetical protein
MPKFEMFRNQTVIESFSVHDTIFSKGDPRTVMYVVKEGEVEIRLGDRVLEWSARTASLAKWPWWTVNRAPPLRLRERIANSCRSTRSVFNFWSSKRPISPSK